MTCEEAKAKVLREIEETFTRLVKKLKERKNIVIKQVEEHFAEEMNTIQEQEQKW